MDWLSDGNVATQERPRQGSGWARCHRGLWSIVLAGGAAPLVSPLIERWIGRPRPKQFCNFVGTRSLWQHTIDRAARLTRPDRVVAVVGADDLSEAEAQLDGHAIGSMLVQPHGPSTAAGIFLPLTYIRSRDPNATVVVFPADHFVYPETCFLRAVRTAAWAAEQLPERIVLIGAPPTYLELEYGWIQPGARVSLKADREVHTVRTFVEKPSAARADLLLAGGSLWNTLVFAAKVDTLWRIGWQACPVLMGMFERLGDHLNGVWEDRVMETFYHSMPPTDFAADILERVPEFLAVLEMTGVLWSDWGNPARIAHTLRQLGRDPAFPLHCFPKPLVPNRPDVGIEMLHPSA